MAVDPDLTTVIEIELGLEPSDKEVAETDSDILQGLGLIGCQT